MPREEKKHAVYFNRKGEAIGYGVENSFSEPMDIGQPNAEMVSTLLGVVGQKTERVEEIDEATYKDLDNPGKKLSIKDFKIKPNGKG